MKSITISVPDDVYRRARLVAAEQGRSVSALVTEFLSGLADREPEFTRLEALQAEVLDGITRFRGGDRLERDRVHDRALH